MSISRSRGPCVAAEQFVAGQGVFADGVAPVREASAGAPGQARSIQEVRHSSQRCSKSRMASSVFPARQRLGLLETLLSGRQHGRHDADGLIRGHVRRDLCKHGRIGLGEDAIGRGDPLAEQPASACRAGC